VGRVVLWKRQGWPETFVLVKVGGSYQPVFCGTAAKAKEVKEILERLVSEVRRGTS